MPIFVLTHKPPQVEPKQDENLTFTLVADGLESAVAQATAAAGERRCRSSAASTSPTSF